jgi:hypothetical protein
MSETSLVGLSALRLGRSQPFRQHAVPVLLARSYPGMSYRHHVPLRHRIGVSRS